MSVSNTTQHQTGVALENFDREAWLTELSGLICDGIISPVTSLPTPKIRISVGYPPGRRGGKKHKVVAVCFPTSRSSDQTNEIFCSPEVDDIQSIAHTVAHELIHAFDDCKSGHQNFFAKTARKIGLVGKLTATTAGPELAAKLQGYIDLLGPLPHAKMVSTDVKVQPTRMHKVKCNTCGFSYRTTDKWIEQMQYWDCACCEGTMILEDK